VFDSLGEIKCPVLYVFGGKSEICHVESIRIKRERTGKGDVEAIVIKEAGHLIPQEEVDQTGATYTSISNYIADAVIPFVEKQVLRWKKEYEKDLRFKREPQLPTVWISQLSIEEPSLRKLQAKILEMDKFKAKI
jgi:hypothetical protein